MNRRLALKLLGAVPVWAQRSERQTQPAQVRPPSIMDAVVTDHQGNPVRDLAPGDFTINAGDKPGTVAAFASVDTLSGAVRTAEPLPLPAKLDPGEIHRTLMLVVDDDGISAAGAAALREALAKFVNQQIGARDVVGLLRSSGGNGALEHLTSDRTLLNAAIGRVAYNPAAHPPSTPAWTETLRYALDGLRSVRGRKAVVLFWERAPGNYDFAPLIALANRAWSSVYPVHPGPLPTGPAGGGMARLARETGGLEFSEDVPAALARVLKDQESFYLFGVQLEAEPSPSAQGQPLTVKVSRPGLELRSRAGLPGIAPFVAFTGSPEAELSRAIASSLNSGTIPLRLSALFSHGTANYLDLLLLIDARALAVTHKLNGKNEAGLGFLLMIVDMNGQVVDQRTASQAISLTDDEYRHALEDGLPYAIRIPVAKPGLLEVRAAVLDTTNSNTGIAHCPVEIPDVSKGELQLSGMVLELGSSADNAEAPAIEAARRLFRSGQRIAYRCSVYNATVSSGKQVELGVRTTMFRAGRTVYAGASIPLTSEADSPQGINVLGRLDLGPDMGTGELVLQVVVTDNQSPGGAARTASAWTDLTIE